MKENNDNNLSIYFYEITEKLDKNIKDVARNKTYHKLEKLFECINEKNESEKMTTYENIINFYLEKISDFKICDFTSFIKDIEQISSFFDYAYFIYDNEIKKTCYTIEESAEEAANDLTAKCCKNNGHHLSLPININNIISYSINYKVPKKNIEKVLLWIILRLSIAHFLLTDK